MPHEALNGPTAASELCPGTILIVDDDRVNRTILRKPLEIEGYTVVEAEDGQQAARQVAKALPDVILLDVMMPKMDGFEVCRILKSNGVTAAVPVLMVTALGEKEQRLRGIRAGANDFLTKPVDVRELTLRVRNAVHLKKLYDQVKSERQRADELLMSVLPRVVAERMKRGEREIAEQHPEATVLVAHLSGLAELASSLAPEQVVILLTELFDSFDTITDSLSLEKVKTFGQQYMAAGGLGMQTSSQAAAVVELAIKMRTEVRQFNSQYNTAAKMRIGIGSGPVVGGVIGRKKFTYEIWGDAVNWALRLESIASVEAILVDEATYAQVRRRFEFERHKIQGAYSLLVQTSA